MTDKEKLLAEQGRVAEQRDAKLADAKKMDAKGEVIPKELRDEITNLQTRHTEISDQLAAIQAQEEANARQNSEFLGQFSRNVTQATEETPQEYPALRSNHEQNELMRTMTRETVAVFGEELRRAFGSSVTRMPTLGVATRRDPLAEALSLDMLCCDQSTMIARSGEFLRRYGEILGKRGWNDADVKRTIQTLGTGAEGGAIVPDDNTFMNEVQMAQAAYGGAQRVSRIVPTADGRPLPIPTIDDTAATGAGVAFELGSPADVNLAFGEQSMRAYMITSGRLSAAYQAIEDAGPNLPTLLGMLAGERIMRREARMLVDGTGPNTGTPAQGQPLGLRNVAAAGHANNEVIVLNYDRSENQFSNDMALAWITIKFGVNAAYRMGPRFTFLVSGQVDQGFAGARVSATDRRFLFENWAMGDTVRSPLNMGGMQIFTDSSLPEHPTAASTAKRVNSFVGDFDKFWIRRVAGMYRLVDPFTGNNFSTRWTFGRRIDSTLLFGGTNANSPIRGVWVASVD